MTNPSRVAVSTVVLGAGASTRVVGLGSEGVWAT